MALERERPSPFGDERAMLNNYLDFQRATLESKCLDLTDDQLRERAIPPSSVSLLGLVRHLAEVERRWFSVATAHEELDWIWEDDGDLGFAKVDNADVQEAFDAWHEQIEKSRAIEASVASLDTTVTHPRRGDASFRWVMIHLIEEYSRHLGHADFLRERLDGVRGT